MGKEIWRRLSGALLFGILLCGCAAPWQVPAEERAAGSVSADAGAEEAVSENVIVEPEPVAPQSVFHDAGTGADYAFKSGEQYLEIYDGEQFRPVYLNGVNIGSGYPGYFPGELAIPKETYLRWFEQIADMHCNVVRVYTTMMPAFYDALYEYNRDAAAGRKLYLLMGVWYDEDTIERTGDAYDLLEGAVGEACEQIDIIHGNCVIEERSGRAYGTYTRDVSEYVLGWILGIESDAWLVGTTDEKHPERRSYEGEYLYTGGDDIQAFDCFLCELGDKAIAYEMEHYGMQRPVSWANWPTADVMEHPDEPSYEVEDAVTIHVERFHARDNYAPGIFASYHIYPYYPEFLVLEERYTSYVDADRIINPYEAYLKQLLETHHVPVLVAEYGLPASRGCTHVNPYSGLNQGHLNEQEQGEGLCFLAENIYRNGYAGGIVFTWQDEWFKRTWNTMEYSDPERRPFWSDIQTSEQNFGLLAFDPGAENVIVKIDGNAKDWSAEDVLCSNDGLRLSVKYDQRYLYLAVQGEDLDPEEEHILIPVDETEISGSAAYGNYRFERPADFLISLNGRGDSHVYVQSYYDRYAFLYQDIDNLLDVTGYAVKDSMRFNPIYLSLNKQLFIPSTGEVKDAMHYETGALRYGNADPEAPEYDSLADFCYGKGGQEGFVELRIAWGLLNFRDPSTKEVEGDFWKKGDLVEKYIDGIWLGVTRTAPMVPMAYFTWENWDSVEFHERLKKSYYLLGDCYEKLVLPAETQKTGID